MCSDLSLNWWKRGRVPADSTVRERGSLFTELLVLPYVSVINIFPTYQTHNTVLYVYNLRHSVRVYVARLQFVPYPPACHVRGLLVRPWVVPRGTSSIVPGSSGTLHHCPAPSTRCFPDPVVSNYFICRLPQFSQTAVKWRFLPVLLSLLTRPRHVCTSCGGR